MTTKKQPKKPKLEPITLTIRAKEAPEIALLNQLKEFTGSKTFSSAIFAAAKELPVLKSTVQSLNKQINDLVKIKKDQMELLHFLYSGQKQMEAFGKKYLKNAGKYPEPEIDFDDDFN